jgi:hypothetical protein
MEKIFKLISKYWFIISLVGTLASTALTEAWYFVGRIEKGEAALASLQSWVGDHDDAISDQHDDILILKEDERLRQAGLLK